MHADGGPAAAADGRGHRGRSGDDVAGGKQSGNRAFLEVVDHHIAAGRFLEGEAFQKIRFRHQTAGADHHVGRQGNDVAFAEFGDELAALAETEAGKPGSPDRIAPDAVRKIG